MVKYDKGLRQHVVRGNFPQEHYIQPVTVNNAVQSDQVSINQEFIIYFASYHLEQSLFMYSMSICDKT